MKPSILKGLEDPIDQTSRPPLRLINMMTCDLVDRKAYWSGPEDKVGVLARTRAPVDSSLLKVHTTIRIHPVMRDRWQATASMEEDIQNIRKTDCVYRKPDGDTNAPPR